MAANLQKMITDAKASIAAAQTVLNRYPQLQAGFAIDWNGNIRASANLNAVGFLTELLQSVGGSEVIIRLTSKFISTFLPVLEFSVKSILKANISNMLTCSINPFIKDELIRDGIWFSISQIDAMGYLNVNPLNKQIGQYFYFGCTPKEGISITSDLYKSPDMNAFIWYVKNKAVADNARVVWDNKNAISEDQPDKLKPVVTMEYFEASASMTDIEGNTGIPGVIPTNDMLHVFLGDAKNNRSIMGNRYYKKTLIQFNWNYIDSLKLFDPTVVAAQLLDRLTGALNIHLAFSREQMMLQYTISEMVSKIIENDDVTIDDCFFTFSNDQYNSMLNKSELQHAGLFTIGGETNSTEQIDPASIFASINGISSAATKKEQETIIEGALYEVSANLMQHIDEESYNVNFNVQMNFITNILKSLAYVAISALMSPKVYILLAINLRLMGYPQSSGIMVDMFNWRTIFFDIISMVKDLLIKFYVEFLMKELQPLILGIQARYAIETSLFYAGLIKSLIDNCKWSRSNNVGIFNMDNVTYADILEQETASPSVSTC